MGIIDTKRLKNAGSPADTSAKFSLLSTGSSLSKMRKQVQKLKTDSIDNKNSTEDQSKQKD